MSEKFLWWGIAIVGTVLPAIVWFMNDGGRGEALAYFGFAALIAGIALLIKKIKEHNNSQ